MKKSLKPERRLYPRIDQKVPLKIVTNGYDLATTTQNISCIGAYCHVEKYIPPFTTIAVKMTLPVANGIDQKNYDIQCRGVVVRTEDEANGGFNIAVFFNRINDPQRQRIVQYITQFLP